jgi:hypothetical protein
VWDALAGKPTVVLALYEACFGIGSGKGLGWAPMLCAIARRVQQGESFAGRP